MNSLFACACSSHTLCTSGGGWTAFSFQGRYTAGDLPVRNTRWKGMHHLHFCSFISSLREGDGGEGMVFGLYLIKGEGAVKNSWCNVSLTQGRTIYRSLQYLPEGTWEQSGAVLHKAGWEHTCALTAAKVKPRACLTVGFHSPLPGGEKRLMGSFWRPNPSGEKLWFVESSGVVFSFKRIIICDVLIS